VRLLAVLLLSASVAAAQEPPRALACLARWYAVQPVHSDAGWFAALPDGQQIPYEKGERSLQEKVEAPAVKDMFAMPYRTGPWTLATDPNDDPGRIRVEPIFRATYGDSLQAVSKQTSQVDFFGQTVRMHVHAAAPLRRVVTRLKEVVAQRPALKSFLTPTGGTLVWRRIAGTKRLSAHAYGIAIDLNPGHSHYWRWSKTPPANGDLPTEIIEAFEAEGFIWGGRWHHFDTMHFEWRPELLEATCQP
jgi:hypothetical protein